MSSSRRKVARVISALVAMLLLFSMPAVAAFAAVNATSANQHVKLAPSTIKGLQAQLDNFLKKDTELRHKKLIRQKITLTAQQISGADVAVVFDVERTIRLNYATANDVPAMKGRLAYMKDHASQLSQDELASANQEIAGYHRDLESYITTDHTGFQRIKVTATLDPSGMPLSNTIKFYSEGFLPGQYGLWDPNEIPSPQKVEKEAYNGLGDYIKKMRTRKVVSASADPPYNRFAASDYIYTYTSNTSARCTSGVIQNPYYYNPNYTWFGCDDCANYVSQAMSHGGVPLSYNWQPYSTDWVNANALIGYMWNVPNIYSTNQNGCLEGYPFGLFNSSNVCTHVMMVDWNDGYDVWFSAHTNDRKDYWWWTDLIPSGDHVSWFGVYPYVY